MAIHFEELWEKCETFHKDNSENPNLQSVIDELMLKLNLYKVIAQKSDIPKEEADKIKSRTIGEILLTLTHISLLENVNVFEVLNTSLKYRSIDSYSKKY